MAIVSLSTSGYRQFYEKYLTNQLDTKLKVAGRQLELKLQFPLRKWLIGVNLCPVDPEKGLNRCLSYCTYVP
jgi:hypothetical protein